ncbi:hypothetical protein L249_5339 [Ophiocordyceps polyrhachis-furcata BCC 54312]|uniref:Uncharacterized protein n=1 Tax=Ophiocordyceps polyrhachis-furcata BCC 54312 TaxID=1330021 RepID=A0A367L923_9HYPO|nr:hypothetical protein L249_5339 [Ophiocordyceps polyrhachis-furcata BCC 54312]
MVPACVCRRSALAESIIGYLPSMCERYGGSKYLPVTAPSILFSAIQFPVNYSSFPSTNGNGHCHGKAKKREKKKSYRWRDMTDPGRCATIDGPEKKKNQKPDANREKESKKKKIYSAEASSALQLAAAVSQPPDPSISRRPLASLIGKQAKKKKTESARATCAEQDTG